MKLRFHLRLLFFKQQASEAKFPQSKYTIRTFIFAVLKDTIIMLKTGGLICQYFLSAGSNSILILLNLEFYPLLPWKEEDRFIDFGLLEGEYAVDFGFCQVLEMQPHLACRSCCFLFPACCMLCL